MLEYESTMTPQCQAPRLEHAAGSSIPCAKPHIRPVRRGLALPKSITR